MDHDAVASDGYARNARTHSEDQVAAIAGSIREFGFVNPVLVDGENGVIAGHGRLLAARRLGLTSAPVIELGHLSEAQKRAYVLADNKLAERAGWDLEMLALEAGELAELGVDLAGLGFGAGEIDDLLHRDAPDPREEETPEPPADPASRPGDLWLCGPHRVLCGDATNADSVARLLDGVQPHLLVTDPPYGVAYDPAWRNESGAAATKRTGKVMNDDRADWREAYRGERSRVREGSFGRFHTSHSRLDARSMSCFRRDLPVIAVLHTPPHHMDFGRSTPRVRKCSCGQ